MIKISIHKLNDDKFYYGILFITISIYSAVWSLLSVLRYNLYFPHLDTAGYENILWNTIHGDFFKSTMHVGLPFFRCLAKNTCDPPAEIFTPIFSSHHINLIVLFFAPIYAVFPYTEMLYISEHIILASAAIPIYLIAKNELKNRPLAIAISSTFLIYPALQATAVVNYNFLAFALPLLLWAFYFFRKENWKLYWLFIALSLTVREDVSLFVMFLGITLLFFKKSRKIGLITTAIGLSWFILSFFVIMPIIWDGFSFDRHFCKISDCTIGGIPETFLNDPMRVFNHVFQKQSLLYLFQLFSHTGFLSVLNPLYFLMSLPILIENLLLDSSIFRIMWAHHNLLIIPGVYVSTIFSIKKILKKTNHSQKIIASLIIFLIITALVSNTMFSPTPFWNPGIKMTDDFVITDERRWTMWEFFNLECCGDYSSSHWLFEHYSGDLNALDKAISIIPDDASVSSQDYMVSHLSKRKDLHLFPIFYDKVDYVLVKEIPHGKFHFGWVEPEVQEKYISILKNSDEHKIVLNEHGLLLFQKIT